MKNFNLKLIIVILLSLVKLNYAQDNPCLDCHSDEELTGERNGHEISLFVDEKEFSASVHADLECTDCHEDFNIDEIPHREGEDIYKVSCTNCHDFETDSSMHLSKNECFDCHSKHSIKPADELKKGNAFCLKCHDSPAIKIYEKSVHSELTEENKEKASCIDCHSTALHQLSIANFKFNETCGKCHSDELKNYISSKHGKSASGLAPKCNDCHNPHDVNGTALKGIKSKIERDNLICGKCHKKSKITKSKKYELIKDEIHFGSWKARGLGVVPSCTDCHSPHTLGDFFDANIIIGKKLKESCEKCHTRIEGIHKDIVEERQWEKNALNSPICVDCHKPHEIDKKRRVNRFENERCLTCHSIDSKSPKAKGVADSLKINIEDFSNSVHKNIQCIKCHTKVDLKNEPICNDAGKVECKSCHTKVVNEFNNSMHGRLKNRGAAEAPTCSDCHSKHNIKSKVDASSPTYRMNIPQLCGQCHIEGEKAAKRYRGKEHYIIKNYKMSIHGKGLLESGLVVSATCIDCHTSHNILPASLKGSTVSEKNIPTTCAKCHKGIYDQFKQSIHSPEIYKGDKKLPTCYDCHKSHSIERTENGDFRKSIIDQCGRCHEKVAETYFDTFHGKVTKLGDEIVAKCYDCHGAHNILPSNYTSSTINKLNIVSTCKKCHENSNRNFAEYLAHATHDDKAKYPYLYYTFWFMTLLLLGTFTFFGIHTILWLIRGLKERHTLSNKLREKNDRK